MNEALIYSSVTGILFSLILLFYNKGYKTANRYLAGFFFFISLFVLSQYSGLYNHNRIVAALLASGPTPFVFLIGPLSFFYIRSIVSDNSNLRKKDYLHFAPFAIEFVGMVPYYFSSWEHKLSIADTILSNDWNVTHLSLNVLFPSPINSFLRPIHLIIYTFLQWRLVRNNLAQPIGSNGLLQQSIVIKRWLLMLLSTFTLFLICYGLITANLFLYEDRTSFQEHSSPYLLIGSLAIVLLNLFTLLFPQVLYGLPRMRHKQQAIKEEVLHFEKQEPTSTEKVKSNTIQDIEEKLQVYLEAYQPWTDKNFSIATIAIALHIPEHHLRYYFNQHLHLSFSQYRNTLRVQHAKTILASSNFLHLSMEGIGSKAGFSSKSSFFSVFKQETGCTPHEFQAQQRPTS